MFRQRSLQLCIPYLSLLWNCHSIQFAAASDIAADIAADTACYEYIRCNPT